MPGLLLVAAVAGSFGCEAPRHRDGDNVRCANIEQSIRLQGIDAPEMPGSCRPGRTCTPGDPYAARDYLRGLTQGHTLACTREDVDRYGRIIARCSVDGVDLSCAMIAAGHAVPRYAELDCDGQPGAPTVPAQAPAAVPAPPAQPLAAPTSATPPSPLVAFGWLALINLLAYAAFAFDKARARSLWKTRLPERWLLALAALGGSAGAWAAMVQLRHKLGLTRFVGRLAAITAAQAGLLLALLWR